MPQASRPAVVQETSSPEANKKQQQRNCKQMRKVRDQACVRVVVRENIPGRQCLIVLDNKAGRV